MKLEEYNNMYKKIETSKDMDQRIIESVCNNKRTRKSNFLKIAGAVAVFAVIVGVYQIPTVNAAVKDLIDGFTSRFIVNSDTVEMTGEYQTISEKASKQNIKLDTLSDAETELGIHLLKSKDAYEGEKKLIKYNPHVNDKGELYGVLLMDDFYAIGDIEDPDVEIFEEVDCNNAIHFKSGEKYKTPIAAEITVRGDKNTDKSDDGEVNYKGNNVEIVGESRVYELESIGAKAVITTLIDSGMPAEWEDEVGETGDMTEAVLVHDGVEYHYYGVVSQETMMEFLDGLSY